MIASAQIPVTVTNVEFRKAVGRKQKRYRYQRGDSIALAGEERVSFAGPVLPV
jgi:hypothetical protein